MEHQRRFFLFLEVFLIILQISSASKAISMYNVNEFGAKADGKTDSTKAFQSTWGAACASTAPATMHVSPGRYLLGVTVFEGKSCKNNGITLSINGTLVANGLGISRNWIKFHRLNGLSVYGGTFDGQGTDLWSCKNSGKKKCSSGATNLGIYNSNNVVLSGLTSLNSQRFHIIIDGCKSSRLEGVKISADENSPNTDGIHVLSSSEIKITDSQIATGDDCISIGPGTSNLWIENIECGPGHGISIGSLGWKEQEDGVQNVTVKSVTFNGTENGLRVKTLARPSNGFVKGVLLENAVMFNVQNPIIIDQQYCPDDKGCPEQDSGIKISDVTCQDVHGTSSTQVGVKLNCSKKIPCSNIKLDKINIYYNSKPATASCINAAEDAIGVVHPSGCL